MDNKTVTYGLSHLAVAVRDIERTLAFYTTILDMEVMYHEENFIQLTTPGCNDIIVFEKDTTGVAGKSAGIVHFGFRLRTPEGITEVLNKLNKAGVKIKDQGEFVPGSPYVFFYDPDGYEVEVWYEKIMS